MHTRHPLPNCCHPKMIKLASFIIFIKPTLSALATQMPPSCIQSFHIFTQPKIKIFRLPALLEDVTNFRFLHNFVDPWLYHSPHCPLYDLPNMLHVGFFAPRSCTKYQLLGLGDRTISFAHVCNFGRWSVPMHEINILNITMLHLVSFHNVTCYTISLLSCIHVSTTKFCNITHNLITTSGILWSLECSSKIGHQKDTFKKDVRLRAQNTINFTSSIVNMIGWTYATIMSMDIFSLMYNKDSYTSSKYYDKSDYILA